MSTYDHEIKIGTEAKGLKLIRGADDSAMYQVIEEIPQYQPQLTFTQTDWLGGHGQYDFEQPDVYFEGQSIDTTQDGRVFLGPLIYSVGISGASLGANPVCFCWFNAISKWMVATAHKIFMYDDTNFVEQDVAKFTAKTITGMVEFNDILFVSLSGTDEYYYSSDGAAFTESGLTEDVMHGFFTAPNPAGTANILWGWLLPNEVFMNTVGTNAGAPVQWDSGTNVGDISNNITNMFLIGDNLMIGKEDNLFHYDANGGIHPLMDDLKHNRSSVNFKYITQWQTGMYFSLISGLGEITSYNAYEPMGPLTKIDNIGKTGTCVGIASDKDWLYVAIDEGTNTIIYKGREVRREGRLRWEWCPWVFLGANACATAKVCQHSSTDRRLWFGYGNYAGYVILSDNPTADTAAKFAASGWLRMSYTRGTSEYWDKLWQSVITETTGCSTNLTVTPKYRKDTDSLATALTDAITQNGNLKTNLNSELSCKRIQFELHLATNDDSNTPEVLFFQARGVEKPETVRIHEATYEVADESSQRTSTIRGFLRGGRTSTSLIRFADLRYGERTSGAEFVYCIMMPGFPQEIEIMHEKGKQPELGIIVRLQEVSYA